MWKTAAGNRNTGNVRGLLARLRGDTSGNTLAMMAIATIPLAGMVGSAVDIGRGYLVKSRLQQACDAGVLAARRAMAGPSLDAGAVDLANKFFNVNFSNNTAGATNVTFSPTNTSDNQVTGTATARVPFTITKALWGKPYADVTVLCDARLEISNTDVMMVLDTTGSMAGCPGSGGCTETKIQSLRAAVVDFFDTIDLATSADSRFRIGFAAYSSAVNMGRDPFTNQQLLNDDWLKSGTWDYQSRVARMDLDEWTGTTSFSGWTNESIAGVTNSNCTRYGRNESFSGYAPASTLDHNTANSNPNNVQAPLTTRSEFQATDQRRIYERVTAGWGSGTRSCTRRWRVATTTYVQNGRFAFSGWEYRKVQYNIDTYRAGTPVNVYTANTAPTGSVTVSGTYNMVELLTAPGSTVTGVSSTYDGCIEERSGNPDMSFTPIPASARDLDITNAPNGSWESQWRPMWPELVFNRDANNGLDNEIGVTTNRSPMSSPCPSPSSKLAKRTKADVQNYVDSLVATGATYHDFGMAWGARMLSPTGMWAAENSTAPNGRAISRHLIFMTDGILEPSPTAYSSQGSERSDRRVVGTGVVPTGGNGGTMAPFHNARFQALCNAARANNMTVWTVNFSTSSQPTLVSCADPGKAFDATNGTQLRAQFQSIAAQIAELRLSK